MLLFLIGCGVAFAQDGAPAEESEPLEEVASSGEGPFQYGAGRNMWGGRVLSKGETQLIGAVGYPDTEVGVRFGLGAIDLKPNLRVTYRGVRGVGGVGVMLSPGLDARISVMRSGPWSASLTAEIPVHLVFQAGTSPMVGIGLLHPGFLATYDFEGYFDINFGLRFVDDLFFRQGGILFVGGVPLVAGIEAQVIDRLQLGFRVEGGPRFSIAGNSGAVTPQGFAGAVVPEVRAQIGVGYTF